VDTFLRDLITGSLSGNPLTSIVLSLILIWSLIWKGLALWHAAKIKQVYWFTAILILNTAGILEIAYLFFIAQEKFDVKNIKEALKSLKFKKTTKESKKE